ncbi:TRPM7 [Mytilus coruscus]|uniref:TRPM7 n=1 Tax=Mytilus coruscus TaxID=42192 RepID=A0A6J8CTM0_MYTCO|nr:TRPM7 [Mytilus coruscus]
MDTNLWKELQNLREYKTSKFGNKDGLRRLPESPKLVLSVIGDSNTFVPKPWLTSVFQSGLIETAKGAKDCLILYKGSTEKVSSIVREAVENFQRLQTDKDNDFISLVGILPEYNVCEAGLHRHKNQQYGREYWEKSTCVLGDIYNIAMTNDRYPEFHASMIKGITKNKTLFMNLKGKSLKWHVPVLTIVAEGDLDTIECVHQLLKQDLPVLILKGTGKAADFIAGFIEDSHSDSSNAYVKDKMPFMFGVISHGTQLNGLPEKLTNIKENKCLVTIVNVRTQTHPEEFTDAVTNAVIRGWSRWKQELKKGEKNDNTDYLVSNTLANTETDLLELPCPETIYSDNSVKRDLTVVIPQIKNNKIHPVTDPQSNKNHQVTDLQSNRNHQVTDPQSNKNHQVTDPQSNKSLPVTDQQSNKNHPITVTMNAVLEFRGESSKNIGKFMETYKEKLTPASLSLYYYIAYQFIQQMHEKQKLVKIENFNILLKEAILADRHDYVSVLLEEEGVIFEEKYFPEIYQETLISCCEEDTDFQNISKWGSSSAVGSLKRWCYIKKAGDFLAKEHKWHKRKDPLKSLVSALQKCKKGSTDFQGESCQTTEKTRKEDHSQRSKITQKGEKSVFKVDNAVKQLKHIKTEAKDLLLNYGDKELGPENETKMDHFDNLIQRLKKQADS